MVLKTSNSFSPEGPDNSKLNPSLLALHSCMPFHDMDATPIPPGRKIRSGFMVFVALSLDASASVAFGCPLSSICVVPFSLPLQVQGLMGIRYFTT